MALRIEPLWPWHWVVMVLATGTVTLLLGRGLIDRWRVLGRNLSLRLTVLGFSLGAALLFATASLNPSCISIPDENVHLVVVMDVSDSVLRTDGGWLQVQAQVSKRIAASVAALPESIRRQGTASIITFRSNAAVAEHQVPLADLPEAFQHLDRSKFAVGADSNIAAGLTRAGELIERTGGRGAILLVSDGHETAGDALATGQHLAAQGITIHVLPVESRGPELAMSAANLPRQVNGPAETFIRGVLANNSTREINATLTLSAGLKDSINLSDLTVATVSIPGGEWARLHQPIHFQGQGLQFIDLTLKPEDGAGEHHRRFFAHVNRSLNFLAIGGDNRWVEALPPVLATIAHIDPQDFPPPALLKEFDAVIVSGVPASQFADGSLAALAQGVEQEGIGLLVINGDHQGRDEETQTVLMSYNDTPLEPLLPVISTSRHELLGRHVIIIIDTSGSMGGWPLEKSKEIAQHIIQNLLRPNDRLDLIAFTAGAYHLVKERPMDEAGKREAITQLASVAASGGTDPREALALIAGRRMSDCGLIFISDGYFDRAALTERPDCRATVFAIGFDAVPAGSPLGELADPFPVSESFNPAQITIPYFESKKFFEPGDFTPLGLKQFAGRSDSLPVPELSLAGTAVTYVKEDADLIAVRPRLAHPVLAYRESGAGYVGVLTTAVPQAWLEDEAGRQAVAAWVTQVAPYTARDRYDFRLTDSGDVIEIQISLVARGWQTPVVDQLAARIEIPGSTTIGLPLYPDDNAPATFRGQIRLPREAQPQSSTLVLSETGQDALSRPQRIPLLIPPAGRVENTSSTEAYSYGLNRKLLQAIAQAGGGVFDPPIGTPFFLRKPVAQHYTPLWPALVVIAVFCHLAAFALCRLDL